MLLVLFTGARREEAVPLKWSDVDFKDKTIIFRETKNKMPHTLPLSNYLFKLLDAVLNHTKQGIIRTYNLNRYDKEKQSALENWERKLLTNISVSARG